MASSMMDAILGMVTPNMKQALATQLGETPQAVQSGLGAATAATLNGLANKAGDSGFLNQITGLLSGGTGQTMLSNLPAIASGSPTGAVSDVVNRFMPMIFGSQQSQVTNGIAQYAGLSPGSGLGVLKMAIPLVFAYFAKLHSAESLTTSSLGSMLRAEAPNLQPYLPSTAFSSSTTTTGTVGTATPAYTATRTEPVRGVVTGTGPRSHWWLIPAILGALLLGWWLLRAPGPRQPVQTAANVVCQGDKTAATTVGSTTTSAWAALGDMTKVRLPNGAELRVPSGGVERRMVVFLTNPNGASSDTRFDFDRLLFDTGQATLQPASQEQLGCVAAILKAYPQTRARIDGYTDNTGDPAANQQLSQQRADSVMSRLVVLGVDPSRMTAKGFGQEDPVADNSTEEGRQKNRRIALELVPVNPNQ